MRKIVSVNSSGFLAIWHGDLGGDPSHQKGTGGISSQGGTEDCNEATAEMGSQELVPPPAGGCYAGHGNGVDGELHIQAS